MRIYLLAVWVLSVGAVSAQNVVQWVSDPPRREPAVLWFPSTHGEVAMDDEVLWLVSSSASSLQYMSDLGEVVDLSLSEVRQTFIVSVFDADDGHLGQTNTISQAQINRFNQLIAEKPVGLVASAVQVASAPAFEAADLKRHTYIGTIHQTTGGWTLNEHPVIVEQDAGVVVIRVEDRVWELRLNHAGTFLLRLEDVTLLGKSPAAARLYGRIMYTLNRD